MLDWKGETAEGREKGEELGKVVILRAKGGRAVEINGLRAWAAYRGSLQDVKFSIQDDIRTCEQILASIITKQVGDKATVERLQDKLMQSFTEDDLEYWAAKPEFVAALASLLCCALESYSSSLFEAEGHGQAT